jgi:citrate lyase beta subunit
MERLRLWLIASDVGLIRAIFAGGVDRVLVDLETAGKAERQAGRGLFLSSQRPQDIDALRPVTPAGALFVRLDPWGEASGAQIEDALARGADGLMLPYFRSEEPVLRFVDAVAGRAFVCPLVETGGAVDRLAALLESGAVSEFHVGLNDLAIDLGHGSLQALWGHPMLDRIAQIAAAAGTPFGIGGVTDPRMTALPVDPRWVLSEQRRLGSTRALLGRSFRARFEVDPDPAAIAAAVQAIQAAYAG